MTNRLALIVDDSRSARHVLTRMLESFGLEVASVESAELALTYLQSARPDVIFMDHLMPGMDGFAAVRVLKSNPDTVTIPVLMYTSQEGEMYLSQARALGAIGVLPKTLKHADVAAVLQQLNLLPADSTSSSGVHRQVTHTQPVHETRAASPPPVSVNAPEHKQETSTTQLNDHSLSQLAHRVATETRDELLLLNTQTTRRLNLWRGLVAVCGALCVVLLLIMLALQNQTQVQLDNLHLAQRQLMTQMNKITEQHSVQVSADLSGSSSSLITPQATVEALPVPYGEVPLSGARLERLRALVSNLRNEQKKSVIRIETFMADFCLNSVAGGSWVTAPDAALQSSCEMVGNPYGDALRLPQRQSVAFANFVDGLNKEPNGKISVQLVEGGHQLRVAYPERSNTLTAGEWNRMAERNQRVEFSVQTEP